MTGRGERTPPRLDELLWRVSAHDMRLAEMALARTPLTPASSGILEAISADPGTTVAELSRAAPVSPQAVRQVVMRLEQRRLVERRTAGKGRGITLLATEAGEAALSQATACRVAHEEELMAALGRPRYEELVELLIEARDVVSGLARVPRRS